MCNPRRLEVNLVEDIEEEWQATAEQSATARCEVNERLERVIPLGPPRTNDPEGTPGARQALFGPAALEGLAEALAAGFRGWQAVPGQEGIFQRDLGELRLTFDSAAAHLLITAERSSSVSGQARASEDYRATIRRRLEIQEAGIAYDDGYQGLTEESVQQKLEKKAQDRLAQEKKQAIEEDTRQARDDAQSRAAAKARLLAEAEAQQLGEEERQLLRQELAELFARSTPLLREELGALLGETLRRSVLRLVRVNGGELRRCEETENEIFIDAAFH